MKNLLIANFKSHKLSREIKNWLNKLKKIPNPKNEISVALPFPYLHLAQNLPNISLSAQDVSPYPPGSYTGEVNADQLKDFQVKYCIIGHSERRKYFNENNQKILNKAELLLKNDIKPVICLDHKNHQVQLATLPDEISLSSVFAYEPRSSIGSGKPADKQEVQKIASYIQEKTSPEQTVLYGGSIDHTNADTYLSLPSISGILVGSESLDPDSFIKIIEKLKK